MDSSKNAYQILTNDEFIGMIIPTQPTVSFSDWKDGVTDKQKSPDADDKNVVDKNVPRTDDHEESFTFQQANKEGNEASAKTMEKVKISLEEEENALHNPKTIIKHKTFSNPKTIIDPNDNVPLDFVDTSSEDEDINPNTHQSEVAHKDDDTSGQSSDEKTVNIHEVGSSSIAVEIEEEVNQLKEEISKNEHVQDSELNKSPSLKSEKKVSFHQTDDSLFVSSGRNYNKSSSKKKQEGVNKG
uniref:Uncharacterized protein n=1 Tax=Meloidogyne hapla TaxID=6305 RepID=A0A1I8BGK7_MELHA